MKGKLTKTATSKLTAAQQAEIKALAALPDDEIDTSDVPELWKGATRGVLSSSKAAAYIAY